MTTPSLFSQLCDITDDLQRQVTDLPYGASKLALEVLVHRLDMLIDATVGLRALAVEDDDHEQQSLVCQINVPFMFALGQRVRWTGDPTDAWHIVTRYYREGAVSREVEYKLVRQGEAGLEVLTAYESDLTAVEVCGG